jgi:hypothetical protein
MTSGVIVERFLEGTGRIGVSNLSEHVVAFALSIVSDIELKEKQNDVYYDNFQIHRLYR